MEHPIPEKWMQRAALSLASTPSCLFLVVWWWPSELLWVSTPACSSLVVWEWLLGSFFCHFLNFFLLCLLFYFFVVFHRPVHHFRLDMDLPQALWVCPILDMNHGALLLPRPEGEFFFITMDIEADFSCSNINLGSCSAQEGSTKDEGRFFLWPPRRAPRSW